MCYPKPGPRCSSHAAYEYTKAHQRVLALYSEKVRARDESSAKIPDSVLKELDRAMARRKKAEQEFALTPAGIKALERELASCSPDEEDLGRQRCQQQLDEAQQMRAARLAAVKADAKQVVHRRPAKALALPTEFSEDGTSLDRVVDDSPLVEAAIAESARWSSTLTDDEVDAVQWYTQDGYSYINKYLTTGDPWPKSGPKRGHDLPFIQSMVSTLDDALAKQPPGEEKVVYRRHLVYSDDPMKFHGDMSIEAQQKMFVPGEEFTPGFFMSTSFDSHNINPGSDGAVIFMEIKTRSAVSLAAVSSMGSREKEYLIPRNAKFRVVDNSRKVVVKGYGKETELTVIQLEELPNEELPATMEQD